MSFGLDKSRNTPCVLQRRGPLLVMQGDEAVPVRIPRLVDYTHPTHAQSFEDFVVAMVRPVMAGSPFR